MPSAKSATMPHGPSSATAELAKRKWKLEKAQSSERVKKSKSDHLAEYGLTQDIKQESVTPAPDFSAAIEKDSHTKTSIAEGAPPKGPDASRGEAGHPKSEDSDESDRRKTSGNVPKLHTSASGEVSPASQLHALTASPTSRYKASRVSTYATVLKTFGPRESMALTAIDSIGPNDLADHLPSPPAGLFDDIHKVVAALQRERVTSVKLEELANMVWDPQFAVLASWIDELLGHDPTTLRRFANVLRQKGHGEHALLNTPSPTPGYRARLLPTPESQANGASQSLNAVREQPGHNNHSTVHATQETCSAEGPTPPPASALPDRSTPPAVKSLLTSRPGGSNKNAIHAPKALLVPWVSPTIGNTQQIAFVVGTPSSPMPVATDGDRELFTACLSKFGDRLTGVEQKGKHLLIARLSMPMVDGVPQSEPLDVLIPVRNVVLTPEYMATYPPKEFCAEFLDAEVSDKAVALAMKQHLRFKGNMPKLYRVDDNRARTVFILAFPRPPWYCHLWLPLDSSVAHEASKLHRFSRLNPKMPCRYCHEHHGGTTFLCRNAILIQAP